MQEVVIAESRHGIPIYQVAGAGSRGSFPNASERAIRRFQTIPEGFLVLEPENLTKGR